MYYLPCGSFLPLSFDATHACMKHVLRDLESSWGRRLLGESSLHPLAYGGGLARPGLGLP
jgi:hypothetical protein